MELKKDEKDIMLAKFLENLHLTPTKIILHGTTMICCIVSEVAGKDKAIELSEKINDLVKEYLYSGIKDKFENSLDKLFVNSMEHAKKRI